MKMSQLQNFANPWTAVVVTCTTNEGARDIKQELKLLQKKGKIHSTTHLLTVEDPERNIGSGGATLNALLVVVEHLSAKRGFNVLNTDVLHDSIVLIIHNGRSYPFEPCGKGFMRLPIQSEGDQKSISNFEHLLVLVERLLAASGAKRGVWVCSTDMLLVGTLSLPLSGFPEEDCVLFTAWSTPEYATDHGVVKFVSLQNDAGYIAGRVADICYRRPLSELRLLTLRDNKVPLVCGLVFLSSNLADSLLSLHAYSPISSCTYLGLDSGEDSLQVSLFFDILSAMAEGVSKETFLAGECGKTYGIHHAYKQNGTPITRHVRALVWKSLRRYRIAAVVLEGMKYMYLSERLPVSVHLKCLKNICECQNDSYRSSDDLLSINSFLEGITYNNPGTVVEDGTVIQNCILKGSENHPLIIEQNCFVSGIDLDTKILGKPILLNANIAFVVVRMTASKDDQQFGSLSPVHFMFGVNDTLYASVSDSSATFCNLPWNVFLDRSGIMLDDVWENGLADDEKCLLNAKLFPLHGTLLDILWWLQDSAAVDQDYYRNRWLSAPRVSIGTILCNVDMGAEFAHCRKVFCLLAAQHIQHILEGGKGSLISTFRAAAAEGWADCMFNVLDALAEKFDFVQKDPGKVARVLANIANLLGFLAGGEGGLRSGPAANKDWSAAFAMFEKEASGNICEGIRTLKAVRAKWMDSPHRLIRAARHYEGAAQILIRQAVFTARKFISSTAGVLPPAGIWVSCECPARIDLFGGWTDTPPICYELGGSVINASILVNGQRPIGAKACRISLPLIILVLDQGVKLEINKIDDLSDYNQPQSIGALAKACIVCSGLVDIDAKGGDLQEWLLSRYGGGIELHTWSLLPQGSGLGTSSIMAAAILATVWLVSGRQCDRISLIHAVLCVEQMLTTGGGWQDQVGGLMGGILHTRSSPALPLQVVVKKLKLSSDFILRLQRHLILIYTGKIRLAKNLLQDVLRNWFIRDADVLNTFQDLYTHSFYMVEALQSGNLCEIGRLMNEYWDLKKALAPGAEPAIVQNIMQQLRPHTYGQVVCGAGGGGFMVALVKQPDDHLVMQTILSQDLGVCRYDVSIDECGLNVTCGDSKLHI